MNKKCDLIIKGGKIFYDNKLQFNNIVINRGKIIAIQKNIQLFKSDRIIDAKNKIVIPGIIDIHFHVRAPSFPERGTVESETRAAAKGGITTLFEMPISDPCMSDAKVLLARKKHFSSRAIINFAFIPAIGNFNNSNLQGLIKNGAIAFKVFTIAPPPNRKSEFNGLCYTKDQEILNALAHAKKSNLVTIFHAEDQTLLDYFKKNENKFQKSNPKVHNATRPAIVEAMAITKILNLNSIVKTKVHIAHVTSELSLDIISFFQNKGQDVTAETCPHYLFKTEKDVLNVGPFGKINPPIRGESDQKQLWKALKNNILSIVASDHASFSYKEKIKGKKNFLNAPPGAPSGELMLPLMLNAVSEKKITFKKMIQLMVINPAKRFNIFPKKGIIKKGSDADLVILDMNEVWSVNKNNLVSKGNKCAHLYYGDKIKGNIKTTIVNGKIAYDGKNFYKYNNMDLFVSPYKNTKL
jgi:dihydroorotase (multifunctional complex type)|tara:strand:+ start:614 stop:2014 length:1401 start_codon:yes stop_codon:yes gene_type:complete